MCSSDSVWCVSSASVEPSEWCSTTVTGRPGDRTVASVDSLARLTGRERVVDADEEVARDVAEMTSVPQPRSRRRDVVGRALARSLEQHAQPLHVVAVPRGERLQELEPF